MSAAWSTIQRLRRTRPKSAVLRGSATTLLVLALLPWVTGAIEVGELFTPRRWRNLVRFTTVDAVPFPFRSEAFDFGRLWRWITEIWVDRGREATLATLWIAVSGIALAGVLGLVVAPFASRSLARREPYALGTNGGAGRAWRATTGVARLGCVLLRALPEYVWAFLLVAMLPMGAWAAVLALAIHNGGILGRLYGDTLENLPPGALRAARMSGAGRRSLYLFVALPLALPRLLLYLFYRFETCVREATVLGMLGVVSLGYEIREARARQFYDEMLLFVILGACIVLVADLGSQAARRWVREAGATYR